ncbi:uncharacterized protein LOC142332559 [Lycorma delicatula]|uniref:uncharacterized protein LOC142332559 n=1 Tax=Lycorma delicatula TaxID=130591 RepID=UPI003F519308
MNHSDNILGDEEIKSLSQRLKNSQVTIVNLSCNIIGDKGAKYLAEILKDTQITTLNLFRNEIGDEGAKFLARHLKESRVTDLNLSDNYIGDEGAKYLAEILKDTQITRIDLRENNIGVCGAQYLDLAQGYTKRCSLKLDINYCANCQNYIRIISSYSSQMHQIANVTLYGDGIGTNAVNYLNQRFKEIPIVDLTLNSDELNAIESQYLAQAFNDIEIMNLNVHNCHVMQTNGIQYLVKIFRHSRIVELNLCKKQLKSTGAKYVANLLKEINIIDLNISMNCIEDEGVKHLVSGLKNNTIRRLLLSYNNIRHEGAKYLAEILKDTQITSLDLCYNRVGVHGAKYLANGLKNSQVTRLGLDGNMIKYKGYRYLIDTLEDTNLYSIDLHHNCIEEGLEKGTLLYTFNIERNPITIAKNIKKIFKELVSLNPLTSEFEFIVPKINISTVDVDNYIFLMKSLNDNPNTKAHIFEMLCRNDNHRYNFKITSKINEFITKIDDKFIAFIRSNLTDLLQVFDSYNYVNLVKQFQDMRSFVIVQNLLLRREQYISCYLDENKEILHPYIYEMLNEYKMPLYSRELQPSKKEAIISYYKNHSEIDGVQEIIDLL